MADNVTLDAGSGGATIKTDDDGTAHWQYVKVAFGADNTQTRVVSGSAGLPVAIEAGTNAIGKLAANSGVDIGDVDVASIVPGTGATNLGKAEDAAHSTGDTGILGLAVRRAADTPTSGADGDYEPLKTDANGHLKVEIFDGGDSHTIDGTVTANLSATDNAVLDNIDTNTGYGTTTGNGTAAGSLRVTVASDTTGVLSVDDNGGALTVDNAGTFATQVDGDALTALQLIDDVVATDDTTTHATGTTKGVNIMAAATPTDGSVEANDVGMVAMSTDRRLHVDAQIVGQDADITIADGGNTITVDGTVTANLSATDNTVLDNIQTAVELIDNAISGTEMQVDVVAALPAGTNAIGKLAANSGVDIGDVDVTSISAGSNLVGDVGISGARTSGGTTLYKNIDVDETEDEIKGTAGQVYWIHAMNLKASVLYLKFYNATAASVTVGTTVPDLTFPVPTQGDTNGAGFVLAIPNGIAFGTAITIACTTGVADNDSGAPGANEMIVNLGYA